MSDLAFDEIRAEDPTVRRSAPAEIPIGAFVLHGGREWQVEGVTRRWIYLTDPPFRVPPAEVRLSPETIRTLRAKVERRAFRYRRMAAWLNQIGGLPDGLQGRVFHAFREAVGS